MYDENSVRLRGHTGADPEIRATAAGEDVLSFSLATNSQWQDKAGATQKRVEWHRCKAFGRVATRLKPIVSKGGGTPLAIRGEIRYDVVEKSEGDKRKYCDIVVLDFAELVASARDSDGASESTGGDDASR